MKCKEKLVVLGYFVVGVVYEICNLFFLIKGLVKYFVECVLVGGEVYQLVQVMVKEVDCLNCVVSELLELVRLMYLVLQAVDFNTLINYLLQLVSQDVNSWEIQLRFIVNDILSVIQVDLDRLIQVLLNFYFNVIQAIGQYGVISVTVSESGVGVKISVIDSGKGIAVGQFEVIFILYFIIKVEGIGLGLVVVYNIVE